MASGVASGAAEWTGTGRRTRVIVQSRLNSSRLPGKALLPVGGLPLVALSCRRAAGDRHEVVVATSAEADDDMVATAAAAAGVAVMRGSLDDVLGRFVEAAADLRDEDLVVRLTGDNAVPDAVLVSELVDAMDSSGRPYARIDIDNTPHGLGGEVFTVAALRRAGAEATAAYDREHVTPWLRRTFGDVNVVPAALPPDAAKLRCTIDTLDDYVLVARLFAGCADPLGVPWSELIDRLLQAPGAASVLPVRDSSPLAQSVLVLDATLLGSRAASLDAYGRPDDSVGRALMRAAVAGGITHVETARGAPGSEAAVRRCTEPALAQRLRMVTKIAPLPQLGVEDNLVASATTARLAVEASVERSFAELGRRRADAVLFEGLADARAGDGAAWQRLLDYAAAGEVGLVGVSVRSPAELSAALSLAGVGYLQLPFNVVDRRWLDGGDLVGLGERGDLVVSVRSVYLEGLLTATGPLHGAVPGDLPAVRATLGALAEELGRQSVADLCMAYVLGHSWVTSVAVAALTEQDVRENVALANRAPLTAAQCARVREAVPTGSSELVDPSRWGDA